MLIYRAAIFLLGLNELIYIFLEPKGPLLGYSHGCETLKLKIRANLSLWLYFLYSDKRLLSNSYLLLRLYFIQFPLFKFILILSKLGKCLNLTKVIAAFFLTFLVKLYEFVINLLLFDALNNLGKSMIFLNLFKDVFMI